MSIDFKSEDEVKDYIKNLGTEYRFGCYKEKNPEACHLLGDYLEGISKDFEKAARVYTANCDDYKFAKSCFKAGNYHLSGRGGLPKSSEKGLEYYQRGCDLGSYDSCFRAGFLNVAKSKAPEPSKTFLKRVTYLKFQMVKSAIGVLILEETKQDEVKTFQLYTRYFCGIIFVCRG